ncbi:hypothetical protein T07_15064 [Trichinella nelsoni]|uniref:Uncharacterized protein n=1 Tax=Trichinella nelsoni TaxID=6336 RepID=A0A0V0SIS8_9BILA|nr:hypothetical protein T07_15064 [Trichinella nelsoni]
MVAPAPSELKGTWSWSKHGTASQGPFVHCSDASRAQGFLQSFHQRNFDGFYSSLPISTHPWSSFCNELPLDSLGGNSGSQPGKRRNVPGGEGGGVRIRTLVPFASTYLSEPGFSALMALHTQHRSRQIAKRVKYLCRCAYQLARDISRLQVEVRRYWVSQLVICDVLRYP